MSRTFKDILKNPLLLIMTAGHRELLNWMSDETYLKLIFRASMRKKLNLNDPQTYSEKLQWLKLYDRKPLYTQWVDKYQAKSLAQNIIGSEFIIPTIGLWDHFDDIDFKQLPDQFVLKCTHDSHSVVICKDKSALDTDQTKKGLDAFLKRNYYLIGREWPYKDVKPRIIAEKYIDSDTRTGMADYKVHCFNGVPKLILVCQDRFAAGKLKEDFFSVDWQHLNVKRPRHENAEPVPKYIPEIKDMLDISVKLSQNIPFIRVDFYAVNHKIYVGELTFFPASGFKPFEPSSFDLEMGSWLTLPGC